MEYLSDDDGSFRTLFYSAIQAPGRARLTVVSGEAMEGVSYHLTGTSHRVGRGQGELAFDDVFLSPLHATFFYADGALLVRDEGSLNGTFVRLRGPTPLEHGDTIIAGDHVLRFERLRPPQGTGAALADGTQAHVSPVGEPRFRLAELVVGGYIGAAYASPYNEVAVGREGCDLSFPTDLRMSKRHLKVTDDGDAATLTDLHSKNGTFLRLRQPQRLHHGDYVFLGKQLLRVEIT
jgi:pSer/pThr/pTyr-binding forkhead associated (FHA) protein